jgi:hypothetical protein
MNAGAMGEFSIRAEAGALFVFPSGSKAVLAVISPNDGNGGLIKLESRAAAMEIGAILETARTAMSRDPRQTTSLAEGVVSVGESQVQVAA